MHELPMLNFKQTCDYLKAQLTDINNKMHFNDRENTNESPSNCSHKFRSKSVDDESLDDEAIKSYLQNSSVETKAQTTDEVDSHDTNCNNEFNDEAGVYDDVEDSIFREDELENTLIDIVVNNKNVECAIVVEKVNGDIHVSKSDDQIAELDNIQVECENFEKLNDESGRSVTISIEETLLKIQSDSEKEGSQEETALKLEIEASVTNASTSTNIVGLALLENTTFSSATTSSTTNFVDDSGITRYN